MRQVSTPVTPNAADLPPEGLPVERVVAAQDGAGVIDLDDLERLARALKVRVVELFRPAGATRRAERAGFAGRHTGWHVVMCPHVNNAPGPAPRGHKKRAHPTRASHPGRATVYGSGTNYCYHTGRTASWRTPQGVLRGNAGSGSGFAS